MAGNAIQEFVVKLGTQIDNTGFQQMLNLLDSNKLKALGVTAALTAATTAVYKFVESVTKEEFELRQLARQKNKSLENLRAEQTALKSMGMTLNEIKKEKALQDIYNDLVKTNKALALPNMDKSLTNVRNLQGAFWKLRSVADYAIEWVGAKVLANLEEPITRITNKINELSGWFRDNIHSISTKVASYITAFSKGIIGIAESFETIVNWVNDLPEGIKSIGTAITVLWALIKSGPIGQILTVVTLIGDVIHDYENFQWNKAQGLQLGDEGYVGNLNDLYGIWEKLDAGNIGGVFETMITTVTEMLNKLSQTLDNFSFDDMLKDPENMVGSLITSITKWIKDHQEEFKGLGGAFLEAIGSTFSAEGGLVVELASDLVKALGDVFDINNGQLNGIFKNDSGKANSVASGIAAGLVNSLLGMNPIAAIGSGILATMDSTKDQLRKEYGELVSEGLINPQEILEDQYITKNMWGSLGNNISQFGLDLVNLFLSGIRGIDDFGTRIFTGIADAIKKDLPGLSDIFASIGKGEGQENNTLGDALVNGIISGITTKSFLGGIGGFITTTLLENQTTEDWVKFGDQCKELGIAIGNLIFGKVEEGSEDGERSGGLLKSIIDLFEGLWDGGLGDAVNGIWSKVQEWWNATVVPGFSEMVGNLIDTMYKNGNGTVRALMEALGYQKTVSLTRDENGALSLSDSGGAVYKGEMANEYSRSAMEFIKNVLPYLTIGSNGQIDNSERIDKNGIHTGMKLIKGVMGGTSPASLMDIASYVIRKGKMPTDKDGNEFSWDTVANQYNQMINESGTKLPLNAEIKTKLDNDIQKQINEKDYYANIEGVLTVSSGSDDDAEGGDSKNPPGEAFGGRIGSRGVFTVGEDGTEYIIPITKPERALQLLMQMFGEMGTGMLNRVMNGLGMGQSGTIGGTFGSIASAMQGMTINNTYNISAPVTMYITSTAKAEDVGTAAYSQIDRHMINTLRGVYA